MGRYADDLGAVAGLVGEAEVHRDVYVDEEVFALEMRRLFANTWVYVGHESEAPAAGDFITTEIGDRPVVMVRDEEDALHVLHNRCPHKGTRLVAERAGHTGRYFRCPYHAWTFRPNGEIHAIPLRRGYDGAGLEESTAARGVARAGAVRNYRGFVFARLSTAGIGFDEYFGESLSSLDNMIDRSPAGRLEVAGPPLRYLHRCNWKMLVENQTDACHPMVAHESSAGTAVRLYEEMQQPGGAGKPMAMEVIAPFVSRYEFFEEMGIRVWPNGHGHTGVHHSIHSDYSAVPGYFERMAEAWGEERARAILGENRHNTIYFPNTMVKGPIQLLRRFQPLAADRTLVESYVFRLVDAPDLLLERTVMYNRLINAPTSIVGHDDLEVYERMQAGLRSDGNEWVNLRRLRTGAEDHGESAVVNGTSERQMRNQFAAWKRFMAVAR